MHSHCSSICMPAMDTASQKRPACDTLERSSGAVLWRHCNLRAFLHPSIRVKDAILRLHFGIKEPPALAGPCCLPLDIWARVLNHGIRDPSGCVKEQNANLGFLIRVSASCRLLKQAAILAMDREQQVVFDGSNEDQLSSRLIQKLCSEDARLELQDEAATSSRVPSFIKAAGVNWVSVAVDTALESVLADKLLAGCSLWSLECEGVFVPHIYPPSLKELVVHVSARQDDASEHLQMIMHRIGSLRQLSSLELREVDCGLDLPASLAPCLPPSLTSVRLQLRPTSETDGTLELGAFSSIPSVTVDAAVWDSVVSEDPCVQAWLLPGLKSLQRCKDLYLEVGAMAAAQIYAALADFTCDSCRLGTSTCGWHRDDLQDMQPITVLPKARKVTIWPFGPLTITWDALIRGGGARALMCRDSYMAVLGYTGLLPAEPWVLVVENLRRVSGLPRDTFVEVTSDVPFNQPCWVRRNSAGAGVRWQWFPPRR